MRLVMHSVDIHKMRHISITTVLNSPTVTLKFPSTKLAEGLDRKMAMIKAGTTGRQGQGQLT